MADRRVFYAVADVPAKKLLGYYNTIQATDRALKAFRMDGTTGAEWFNLTHPKTPQWVKDLAMEAHGRTSPEAELHISEAIVRISSRHVLSRKASNLMVEEYRWIPHLEDYLTQMDVPGYRGVTVETGNPDRVVITVDLDVAEHQGSTKDPARRGAFQAVMRLIEDISRFKWHASEDMKSDPWVIPVYTSTDFVITRNGRTEELDLSWADLEGDVQVVPVDDEKMLKRLLKSAGSIARGDELIEAYAASEREHLAHTMS
ncbi:hypothetical protein G6L37_02655 [Agrobacterium rubi]|nr:hypothetical protein [Agrobacterium rubi]NTF24297.1 hypothetical protein [Agrobacterium rubi]